MRARWTTTFVLALSAIALGWALHLRTPTSEQTTPTDARGIPDEARQMRPSRAELPAAAPADAQAHASEQASPVDVHERARFQERAREFFAQAPGLPPEQAHQQADDLSQALTRIEQAGGLSAGETFLLRAGLISYTVPDEQERVAQMRALKSRYEAEARQRNTRAAAQSDPMFELYKVRERQIVAETLSLPTIPNGLTREEYLRRRLQAEREQLLGEAR